MSEMDESAYKLRFELGEHPVSWKLSPSVEASGMLNLEKGYWPRGEVFGDVTAKADASGCYMLPQVEKFETLSGEVLRGGWVQLVDGEIRMMGMGLTTLTSISAVLSNRKFTGDAPRLYKQIRVQIEDANLFSEEPPLKSMTLPDKGFSEIAAEINKDAKITWSQGETDLIYGYDASIKELDFNGVNLVFSPSFTIRVDSPLSVTEWYQSWVVPLREVLSIAAGRPLEVNYLLAHEESISLNSKGDQVFGWRIRQSSKNVRRGRFHKTSESLKLISREVDFLGLLLKMKEQERSGHPLIQTYSTLAVTRDQHPRARVLLALQSLEGAYGVRNQADFEERKKEHEKTRSRIIGDLYSLTISEAEDGQISRSDLRFINKNMAKTPRRALADAIRFYLENIPEHVWNRLLKVDAVANIIENESSDSDLFNVATALNKIRNALSHGVEGYELSDLDVIATVLDKIVRYEFLSVIGLQGGVASDVFDPY